MISAMKDAEVAFAQAQNLRSDHRLEEPSRLHAVGKLSVNLSSAAVKKVHKEIAKIEPMEDAGILFGQHVRELAGRPTMSSPWAKASPSGASGAAPKAAASAPANIHVPITYIRLYNCVRCYPHHGSDRCAV